MSSSSHGRRFRFSVPLAALACKATPNPMLAKPPAMPARASSYAYEPKWDGFRARVSTEHGPAGDQPAALEHDLAPPRARGVPRPGIFDGELLAFSEGQPDFVALCDRMLLRQEVGIPIAFVAFDVLSRDGTSTMREPYRKRRELLENLELAGPHWSFTPSFTDGAALWKVVEEQELEGLVAKPWGSVYKAGRARMDQGQEQGLLEVRDRTRSDRGAANTTVVEAFRPRVRDDLTRTSPLRPWAARDGRATGCLRFARPSTNLGCEHRPA
jgi:ATP dependent DNA ligase domain